MRETVKKAKHGGRKSGNKRFGKVRRSFVDGELELK